MILRQPDLIQLVGVDEGSGAAEGYAHVTGDRLVVEVTGHKVSGISLRWNQEMPASARVLGDHWERGYGDLEWRGYVPQRPLPWYFLLHDTRTGDTHGFGVETGAASLAHWQVDEQGVTLYLDVRSGGEGVRLNGRTLAAATVRYRAPIAGESPYQAARGLCALLCPTPRLPTFPVYGGNDWYYAYGNNSDASIRRDAALIRELSPNRENAPFMVIDAGWFPGKGCNGGPYRVGNGSFPDMAALAAGMESMQVRPGIWVRPLLTTDEAERDHRLPENHPIHAVEKGLLLDPTRDEVKELVRADITRLREWGYQLIKHDFTTFDLTGRWGFQMGTSMTRDGWTFADNTRTTAEVMLDLYRLIREAAGDVILIGCNTVGHLGAGLFELQRTGDDTSGREWERTRKMGINTLAFRQPQHGTFFAADADCVGLTDHVPWELNSQWLDVLARSGTPLFVSADPAALNPERRAALTEAFALAATEQAPAIPLDWLDTTSPRHWQTAEGTKTYNWIAKEGVTEGAN